MITFNNIGYNGRFGNQMFQYAALIGFAKKSNLPFGIPEENSKIIKKVGSLQYNEKFELPECFELNYNYSIDYPKYHYMENDIFCQLPDQTDINGYFQSEKYFINAIDEIKTQFKFKEEIIKKSKDIFKNAEDYISVHIRRGDYLNLQEYHPVLDFDWYKKAMSFFPQKKFLFFSDDIEWCKNQFGSSNLYAENTDKFVDMYTMTRCQGHIIANSSFSWWGAYLGAKKTVAPKTWFGLKINNKNNDSLYPKTWIIL